MPGIFMSRGMTVGIPEGGLTISIDDEGKPQMDCRLHVHFDVSPTWLEIGLAQLQAARDRAAARNSAWQSTDEDSKARALEKEFESSMQVCMASAIAVDAFYATIKECVSIPEATVQTWREKRTPRYAQISEVLKQAFGLKPEGAKVLRQNLKEIFRLRDLAVHPKGKLDEPILHPDLGVGVEWRFAFFRYENARLVFAEALRVINTLCSIEKIENEAVVKKVGPILARIETVSSEWNQEFGVNEDPSA